VRNSPALMRWHWSFDEQKTIETTFAFHHSSLAPRQSTHLTYTMTATANGHAGKRKADDITLDEVDGFSAAQLFGKGTCDVVSDKSALLEPTAPRFHRRPPPATETDRPSIAPSPKPAGVCYTYDDVIFHPGHIDFGAPEVSARTSRPTSPAAHASPPHFFKLLAPNVPFVRPVPG